MSPGSGHGGGPAAAGVGQKRPSRTARRIGYLIGAGINLVVLWLVTVAPGWRAVPFLTEDFGAVVGLVLLSLLLGITLNLGYLAFDPLWLTKLGDAVTAAVAMVVLWRLWQVFPIEFAPAWSGWHTPLRWVLLLGVIGSGIGMVAGVAGAIQALAGGQDTQR